MATKFRPGFRFHHWFGVLLVAAAYVSINIRVLFAKVTPVRVFVVEMISSRDWPS